MPGTSHWCEDQPGWRPETHASRAVSSPALSAPPTSRPARRRPRCASAATARAAFRRWRTFPRSPAQPDLFIQWQLVFFRAGTRKNEQMQPIVEQLNNEDIRNLGAYYASLLPPKAPKPDDNPDLSKKGAQAAVGRRCASCHMRYLRRHQGGRPRRRPARGISRQGAARLQIGRARRRRDGGDGGCRLSPQRGRDRGARALSRASLSRAVISE